MLAIAVFLFAWSQAASRIQTSLGQIPGPIAVAKQAQGLWADHKAEREKAAAFYERQEKRNAARLAKDPNAEIKLVKYTGKPTYIDQIFTSLKTVFTGFLLATLVAVPLGILCGLSTTINCVVEPADPDLQAGIAARVAAVGDHHRQRGVRRPPTRCSRSRS